MYILHVYMCFFVQREVWNNQVRRQGEEGKRLQEQLDTANKKVDELNTQLRDSQRR